LAGVQWDQLINRDDLAAHLRSLIASGQAEEVAPRNEGTYLAPIGAQEVWAAGVTYYRSRSARMEESKAAGGGDFYDRVYQAERPELFFKATPSRVVGHGEEVRLRRDSRWNVPEPELTLLVTSGGRIVAYTVGNDMSSRDIEGENPLYLPQAKVYDRSCALGPALYVTEEPLGSETEIKMEIARDNAIAFAGQTTLASLKRTPVSLVEYLYRETSFPQGCFLLTGTGIVPPDSFTLHAGDEIRITIEPIGTLINRVEAAPATATREGEGL
jgi:2-dehydro-3-deoxy-D-arabinonate dehydratase